MISLLATDFEVDTTQTWIPSLARQAPTNSRTSQTSVVAAGCSAANAIPVVRLYFALAHVNLRRWRKDVVTRRLGCVISNPCCCWCSCWSCTATLPVRSRARAEKLAFGEPGGKSGHCVVTLDIRHRVVFPLSDLASSSSLVLDAASSSSA